LFSCDARSCAACRASCIFCVYLSMRMVQNNKRSAVSKPLDAISFSYSPSSSSAE
jgi:hypothetical protein